MDSQQSLKGIPTIVNIYDDSTFITEENSNRERIGDSTCRPDFPPLEERGYRFQPFNVPNRDPEVKQLPQTPLELFQTFVPIFLVERWVGFTNSWVSSLTEVGVIDSWNHDLQPSSRLHKWVPITVPEVYVFLGILIYMGTHIENNVKDYWITPKLGNQHPLHSFIKFMPYDRFQLLYRHIRIFDHTQLHDDIHFPKVFQSVIEWSNHI